MAANITKDITYCQELLRQGELVAIPTETVYGLAANIHDEGAVQKIFQMKGRPLFNPLIVHIHHLDQLSALAHDIPKAALALAREFWPGSLTLILPKQKEVSDLITAGKPTVALRMPGHPLTLKLLQGLDFPLAAPSANPFTRVSATTPKHVADYFGNRIAAILDGGPCQIGLESTIVGFEGETPIVYRKGGIPLEAIESVVGKVKLLIRSDSAPQAPGMLAKHYSPSTPLVLTSDVTKVLREFEGKRMGVLSFSESHFPGAALVVPLSRDGDLNEAAQQLFAVLHQLDKANLDVIIAERFPDEGLGQSINDRLERAGG